MAHHHQLLIIGGGTAGILLAAKLHREQKNLGIAVVEPSQNHWYQPAWTLVGAGTSDYAHTHRDEADGIPPGVTWIQNKATEILPEQNKVVTAGMGAFTYDYLVVAPGAHYDLDGIEGLREALQQNNVCSNYLDPRKTWEVLKRFKGGNAVFTQPAPPIKCGGAPQKIMYLAEEHIRKSGLRSLTQVIFATPGTTLFGMPEFLVTLKEVVKKKNIHVKLYHQPVKIDSKRNEIHFRLSQPDRPPCPRAKRAPPYASRPRLWPPACWPR